MPRSTSLALKQATYAEETEDGIIILLTIDHEDLTEPILISSDATQRVDEIEGKLVYGTISRGDTYIYYDFEINLPSDESDGVPNTTLSIDNITAEITDAIRDLTSPPVVLIEVVMMSDVDTVEVNFPEFYLTDVEWDRTQVQATITMDALLSEKVGWTYRPSTHRGVFK